MHTLSTYVLITCSVLQGNIDYLVIILERKRHVQGYKWKNTVHRNLKFSQKPQLLLEKENWTYIHLSWCQQRHQKEHDKDESVSKVMITTMNWPLTGTFTFSRKAQLTTFQIQLNVRQGAAFIGGLG